MHTSKQNVSKATWKLQQKYHQAYY